MLRRRRGRASRSSGRGGRRTVRPPSPRPPAETTRRRDGVLSAFSPVMTDSLAGMRIGNLPNFCKPRHHGANSKRPLVYFKRNSRAAMRRHKTPSCVDPSLSKFWNPFHSTCFSLRIRAACSSADSVETRSCVRKIRTGHQHNTWVVFSAQHPKFHLTAFTVLCRRRSHRLSRERLPAGKIGYPQPPSQRSYSAGRASP